MVLDPVSYELGEAAVYGSLTYLGSGFAGGVLEYGRQRVEDKSEEENMEALDAIEERSEKISEPLYAFIALFEVGREQAIRNELEDPPAVGQDLAQEDQEWKYSVEEFE